MTVRRWVVGAAAVALSMAACSSSGDAGPGEWNLVAADGDELTLDVVIGSSSCGDVGEVEVDETDEVVTIDVEVTQDGGDCPADLSTRAATVTLEAPLGDRRLTGCRPADPIVPGGGDPDADCARVLAETPVATTLPEGELHEANADSERQAVEDGTRFGEAWAAGDEAGMRSLLTGTGDEVERLLRLASVFGTAVGEPECTTQPNGQVQCDVTTDKGLDVYYLIGPPGADEGVWWLSQDDGD